MKTTIKTFPDGLRLAYLGLNDTRSVGLSISCAVGSNNETAENNGISHFIEHHMFKGTQKRSAFDIVHDFDMIGAFYNAYTSNNTTCYYAVCTDIQVEPCAEILSDMMFNSQFPEDEIEKERKVILEEISASEDDYPSIAEELMLKAYYGDTPMGRTIIGPRENVSKFTKKDILDYMGKNYCASDIVITIVGNMSFDSAINLVEKYFVGKFNKIEGRVWKDAYHLTTPDYLYKFKDIEQANICIGMPGIPAADDDSLAANIMMDIFGGGMSSRLFQTIREQNGLAYSVNSSPFNFVNNSVSEIQMSTNVKSVKKAIELTRDLIIDTNKNGFSDEELIKGINGAMTRYNLASESTISNMRVVARYALWKNEEFDINAQIDMIKNLCKDKIMETFAKCFDLSKASIGYTGREIKGNLLDCLKV